MILIVLMMATALAQHAEQQHQQCQPIRVAMCQDLRYNLTVMPNFADNIDQDQAYGQLEKYMPLVQEHCNSHIRFFLCSMFVPFCAPEVTTGIPCCRSLCQQVTSDCLSTIKAYNLDDPHLFNCSRFPDSRKGELCMQIPENTTTTEIIPVVRESETAIQTKGWYDSIPKWMLKENDDKIEIPNLQCPPNFARARDGLSFTCAPRCGKDSYYRIEDKRFTESWFGAWAWLCFFSTFVTLATFCVDSSRFKYPERPVILLALCSNLMSLAYIVRAIIGYKMSCTQPSDTGDSYLALDGLESAPCTFIFIALYYFGMASSVWFLNLALSWYLSAAKKWSTEGLENISCYFHVAAWTIPAIFAVAALILRKVAADELTGICQITDHGAVAFAVLPHASLLFGGVFLSCLGGAGLFKVRRAVKMAGRPTSKLEKLMSRLGIFSLLYLVPSLGNVACVLYESLNRPKWQAISLLAALECRYHGECSRLPSAGAAIEITLLRLFLSLVVGITTGMWVWSGKTFRVWGSLFVRAPRKQAPFRPNIAPTLLAPTKRSFGTQSIHVSRV